MKMMKELKWEELLKGVCYIVLGVGLIVSGVTDIIVSIYFAGKIAEYKRSIVAMTEVSEPKQDRKNKKEKAETEAGAEK